MSYSLPLLRPFSALRPTANYAAAVIAPPYDVLDSEEARQQVIGRPYSFLHVSKAEIDFPLGTDPYAPAVYSRAAKNLNYLVAKGVLIQEAQPCFYIYRLVAGTHTQTGIVGAAAVTAYNSGRIRRHELTNPDKEGDRMRQIIAVNAHTGPVLAAHRPTAEITTLIDHVTSMPSLFTVIASDGVCHTLWRIAEENSIARISAAFEKMTALYIADGHHRSAAAARVAADCQAANPDHHGDEMYNSFLLVSFSANEMMILDYNRVIHDLNGFNPDTFLSKVAEFCTILPSVYPVKPLVRGEIGLYMGGRWYRLTWRTLPVTKDPVANLDVFLLANHILTPILGFTDLRRDRHIDFIDGTRGLKALEQIVDENEGSVAFAMYPPSFDELIAITEVGLIMPPKSTWFEPKLADGLLSLPL